MELELCILEIFVTKPDACETASDIARLWLQDHDPRLVAAALQNLANCGLIHSYGETDRPVYYCKQIELVQSVIQTMRRENRLPGPEPLPPPSQEE